MDYLVIGAGPAGLQMGYFLEQAGRDYLILEAGGTPGTFFRTFPRHRRLISINKRHTGWDDPELNLRMDWNSLLCDDPQLLFTHRTRRYFPDADDMVGYLDDFASAYRLRVRYDTRVTCVTRDSEHNGGGFRVTDERGADFQARRLIVATGVSQPYIPPIPGIEAAEPYAEVSTDPMDFTDQRVLIIGKGNSGFETANNLIETAAVIHVAGPDSVRLAWRSHYVGHLRAVNNNLLDTYQLKAQNALLDGTIDRIERDADGYLVTVRFARAGGITKNIRYDRVIVCTGFQFDASIFTADCRPRLTIKDRFPAQTPSYESVNVPDLYFAGTLMQVRDFEMSNGGFIHGFRYAIRALHHILEHRYHGVGWPYRVLPNHPGALADAVLARVNRTSALWQQFAVLCDYIVPTNGTPDGTSGGSAAYPSGGSAGRVARYYEELPVGYIRRERLPRYATVTLEHGANHDQVDPFDIEVSRVEQADPAGAQGSRRHLHPVVRFYIGGKLTGEHHVTESLENAWDDPLVHREPLRAFFAQQGGSGNRITVVNAP